MRLTQRTTIRISRADFFDRPATNCTRQSSGILLLPLQQLLISNSSGLTKTSYPATSLGQLPSRVGVSETGFSNLPNASIQDENAYKEPKLAVYERLSIQSSIPVEPVYSGDLRKTAVFYNDRKAGSTIKQFATVNSLLPQNQDQSTFQRYSGAKMTTQELN